MRAALTSLWPDTDYVHIPEAPQGADRQGRKIDVLILSVWPSRGFTRIAVEIKVSVADWRRELADAAKADFWWRHTHKFYIAVPVAMVDQVANEVTIHALPWGVIAIDGPAAKVIRQATANQAPEPLAPQTWVGVTRAAHDAGPAAIARAEARGREEGRSRALAEIERNPPSARLAQQEQMTNRLNNEARDKLRTLEQALGMRLDEFNQPKIIATFKALFALLGHADALAVLTRVATDLHTVAGKVQDLHDTLAPHLPEKTR